MGLLFVTTTEHEPVEPNPNTVSAPSSRRSHPHLSSRAPSPAAAEGEMGPLRTCWSCLGDPVVMDLDRGAPVCTLCGHVQEDTVFCEEWPRGQLLLATPDLFETTTTENGPGQAVEPIAHTDTPPPSSHSPPHLTSALVAGALELTCWSCLDGPVITDLDSGALVCASCGIVHDAGDAEFVHPVDVTDARTASFVHHGWYDDEQQDTTAEEEEQNEDT